MTSAVRSPIDRSVTWPSPSSDFGRAAGLRDDRHGQGAGRFDAAQRGRVATRLLPPGLLEPDPHAVDVQGIESFQRRHATGRVGLQDLAHQRQETAQCVFRREAARFQPCAKVFVKACSWGDGLLIRLGQ